MKRIALAALLSLTILGCRTTTQDPNAAFEQFEARLLAMDPIDVSFDLRSEGAVESASAGTIRTIGRDAIVNAETTFSGKTTKQSHALTDHDSRISQKHNLVISWARMGLLHNQVRLALGRPIESGAEGDAAAWVKVKNVKWDAASRSFTVEVVVNGVESAHGQIWLDASGRPVRRTQTVRFPNGEMRVEEKYTWR